MIKKELVIVCPYCGCRGKSSPHVWIERLQDKKQAVRDHRWRDIHCGSCKRAFRSYENTLITFIEE